MSSSQSYHDGEIAKAASLAGKTIERVDLTFNAHGDRIQAIIIRFTDGEAWDFGYWATYADDASCEFDPVEGGE